MGFQGSDGFYQSNYGDVNQDYSQQAYSQQDNNAYYGNTGGYGGYDASYNGQQQDMYNPNAAYTGNIMTPQMPAKPDGLPDNYSGGFEDEPPLLEELGINFDHIYQKTVAVMNPWKHTSSEVINEVDLTGPFVFCMALGAAMLMVGKVQFGYIYGIGAVGVIGMWFLLNLMAPKGAHLGVIASVLGYCILPIVILSVINILVSLQGILGTIAAPAAVCWCAISASKLFSDGLEMK